MATGEIVGSVAGIWMFPVKSMKGTRLQRGELTERGLLGDRTYALIDVETGKVASAKSARMFPGLFQCRATFIEPPQLERELPPAQISLPDGTTVTSDSTDVDQVLSGFFGRDVTLARAAPDDFTIDQYYPDVENADPKGRRDAVVEQKLGSPFFANAGLPCPIPDGAFFDLFPVSVLTTSTLDQLSRHQPGSDFDERRFRMNIIVHTQEAGFVENAWIGRELAVGDAMRLQVIMPDPRCVMTTLAQDDLPRDNEILRTLVQHNRLQVADAGRFPCAGVYAIVQIPGSLHMGDDLSLLS